jgi:uncharacterized RDD family membrane protein YckC
MATDITQARQPGLLRRLAAMAYDLILLLGLLMLAVTLVVVPYEGLTGEPFPQQGLLFHLHQVYLACVFAGFHTYFWVHGGQTLGMRAWRFRLLRDDGRPLSGADALRRFGFAALTLGPISLLWVPFDPQGLSPYDRLSRTRPVLLKRSAS